jgi:hypothetical protein
MNPDLGGKPIRELWLKRIPGFGWEEELSWETADESVLLASV